MMNTIGEYENWRDRLQDRPQPDNTPDEQNRHSYSHDYPDDTTLEYVRWGNHAEIRLAFHSEDPDAGVEEMLYAGDSGESMAQLVSDLRANLTAHLEAADSTSFYEQQGVEIHNETDYFNEYTRSALYAFEGILKETGASLEHPITWKAIQPDRKDWLYSCRAEADAARGCIGHLRGDFGRSGTEFWSAWFDHLANLKKTAFRVELQDVVNDLRQKGNLLSDFASMREQCYEGLTMDGSYGFHAESPNYEYCLRCTPRKGDYNFYLYCYDKTAQREYALEHPKPEKMSVALALKDAAASVKSPKPNQIKKETEPTR